MAYLPKKPLPPVRHRELTHKKDQLCDTKNASVSAAESHLAMPPELFNHLQKYLEELLVRHFFDDDLVVVFDSVKETYIASTGGAVRLIIARDKIACGSGTSDEIAFCIQASIDFGWKRIRLQGSDDFKERAYAEAIRRGYRPEDIDGCQKSPPLGVGDVRSRQVPAHAADFKRRLRLP